MTKAKNRNAGQPDSENGHLETETLELSSDQSIQSGCVPKRGKDSVVQLKSAQQATAPSQKTNFATQIGESLQNAYNDILQQPVPDRFLELLRQLESGQPKTSTGSKKDNQ